MIENRIFAGVIIVTRMHRKKKEKEKNEYYKDNGEASRGKNEHGKRRMLI